MAGSLTNPMKIPPKKKTSEYSTAKTKNVPKIGCVNETYTKKNMSALYIKVKFEWDSSLEYRSVLSEFLLLCLMCMCWMWFLSIFKIWPLSSVSLASPFFIFSLFSLFFHLILAFRTAFFAAQTFYTTFRLLYIQLPWVCSMFNVHAHFKQLFQQLYLVGCRFSPEGV